LKCDDTSAETKFRVSAKRTSPFKSAGASVQSTTGSRRVRISGSNVGYTMLRGSVKSTGYPLHSPFSPSLSLPCVTVRHHISTGLYFSLNTAVFLNLSLSFWQIGLCTNVRPDTATTLKIGAAKVSEMYQITRRHNLEGCHHASSPRCECKILCSNLLL